MDISRNQYFMMGLVLVFLGIQFRLIDSAVLNRGTTEFLARRSQSSTTTVASSLGRLVPTGGPTVHKVVHPPQWIGWALLSIGSVLILHSLAMPRPSG